MKIKCKYCKQQNFRKEGFRQTKNRGKIQKYYCFTCDKYFTNDEGFYRMRNSEKIITMSIDMYLSNLSSRKMRNQLFRHFEYKISHISILDWVRRYTLKVHKYIEKFTPQLSGKIYADETDIDREKGHNDVFWCSVDWETRFINATLYSPNSQNMIDALPFYPRAFKKAFYSNFKNKKVKHIVNNVSKTKKHNVRIETVFMKIKDRVYDFRGLKSLWSAPIIMAGIVLQHNFIEKHTTTNKLPCDLANIKLEIGINRWLGLIKLASNNI